MANQLLTTLQITREAVRLWRNSNAFIQAIDRQYDDQFAQEGAKIGDTLRIRLPNDYVVADGPGLSPQDTQETSTTLALATQRHVDVSFSSSQRALKLQDFSMRVLSPMVNNLAGNAAQTIMNGSEGGVSNFVSNLDGSSNIIAPTSQTWLNAGAYLDSMSAPKARRQIVMDQFTQAKTVVSLQGLFNPQKVISAQFRTGMITKDTLGFDWYMDQTVIKHTTGLYVTDPTVAGAGQTGQTINVNALVGPLKQGDVIAFDGVNSVNRITKQDNGQLAQFVVQADSLTGATTLLIYPAIVPPLDDGSVVQYQTVTASPAAGANIIPVAKSGEKFRKNIAFAPEAVTMVTADLPMPKGVHEVAREMFDNISMRFLTDYIALTDQFVSRLDILFGWLWVRPEWAVIVADSVP